MHLQCNFSSVLKEFYLLFVFFLGVVAARETVPVHGVAASESLVATAAPDQDVEWHVVAENVAPK